MATLSPPMELHADPQTRRIRWTSRAVRAIAESGRIDLEGFELLDGELIQKVKNPPHILAFVLTLQCLGAIFGALYCQPEGPLDVVSEGDDTSLPEPDIAVLSRPLGSERPRPDEVRLVVEIADSTLGRDLGRKAALYAQAGIPEYWVVDLTARRLHVHRGPDGDTWREVRRYADRETVSPLAAPESTVCVHDLLPPS